LSAELTKNAHLGDFAHWERRFNAIRKPWVCEMVYNMFTLESISRSAVKLYRHSESST